MPLFLKERESQHVYKKLYNKVRGGNEETYQSVERWAALVEPASLQLDAVTNVEE